MMKYLNFMITLLLVILSTAPVKSAEKVYVKQTLPYGISDDGVISDPRIFQKDLKTYLHVNYWKTYYSNVFYEVENESLSFSDTIRGYWISSFGDYDNDGYIDFAGMNMMDSHSIFIVEQTSSDTFCKAITWQSGPIFTGGLADMGSTNLIKNDGIDRLYGAPNPYTTVSKPYGWWYLESAGNDTYAFVYEDSESVQTDAIEVGFLDNDSLVDVLAGRGGRVWESIDSMNDSFKFVYGTIVSGYLSRILPDLDKDGMREYIAGGQVYAMLPAEWVFGIAECTGDNTYDTIWSHWIRKNYGPDFSCGTACGGDYGDIDGDGELELILCAGSIIEILENVGDNDYQVVWSMDNDTFSGSHVKLYDLNENGTDDIIWTGESDPYLPLTSGIDIDKTYIMEWRRLDSEDTLYFDSIKVDSIEIKYLTITNRGSSDLEIDSVYIDGSEFILDSILTYPFNVLSLDSVRIPISFTSAVTGLFSGNVFYHGDKNTYNTKLSAEVYEPAGINLQSEGAVFDLSLKELNLGSSILEYTTYTKDTRVEVYDITGRNVLSQNSSQIGSNTISLSHLKSGIYFIRLTTPKETISNTIIQMF